MKVLIQLILMVPAVQKLNKEDAGQSRAQVSLMKGQGEGNQRRGEVQ